MSKEKDIEAQITTATGATIQIKGGKEDVAHILSMFAGKETAARSATVGGEHHTAGKLDGIAEKDDEGNVHILVTNLKAKNAMDAASRLIYVTLLARKELLREQKTERGIINKVLKSYNLYDGNTRNIIPRDRALVKEGRKYVALSGAAIPKARKYLEDIQDENVEGSWTPGTRRRRARTKKLHKRT